MTTNANNAPLDAAAAVREELFQQIAWLHDEVETFAAVFGRGPDYIDKLNRRTGHVFYHFQVSMRDAIILRIARLLDPAQMRYRTPVSFERAIADLAAAPAAVREALMRQLEAMRAACQPIVDERHRRISHTDRAVVTGADELPGVSRARLREAMGLADGMLDAIWRVATNGQVGFGSRLHHWHADELFRVLDAGDAKLTADQLERRDA